MKTCNKSYATTLAVAPTLAVLALPPDERENFLGVVDLIASNREKEAACISAATGVDQECTWSRLESTTNDIITARMESALRVLQDPDERMNAIQRAGVDRELFRRQHGPPEPRVFRWGGAPEEGELAAIGRVLGEKKACIGAARRYADAVGASFVPYYLAAFRTLLATSLVELTAVESASCVAAISAGDHYDPHRQFVLEAPSRDANGVPLLSRSEIGVVQSSRAAFAAAWPSRAWLDLPTTALRPRVLPPPSQHHPADPCHAATGLLSPARPHLRSDIGHVAR